MKRCENKQETKKKLRNKKGWRLISARVVTRGSCKEGCLTGRAVSATFEWACEFTWELEIELKGLAAALDVKKWVFAGNDVGRVEARRMRTTGWGVMLTCTLSGGETLDLVVALAVNSMSEELATICRIPPWELRNYDNFLVFVIWRICWRASFHDYVE